MIKKKKNLHWIPKKIKFKRLHKGKVSKLVIKKTTNNFVHGSFGLRVLKFTRLNVEQLEASRRKISKGLKRKDLIWFRSLPDIPVTAKPNEIRMGKGKGAVSHWIYRLSAGALIFEVSFISKKKAKHLLFEASKMLPVPTKFVIRKCLSL